MKLTKKLCRQAGIINQHDYAKGQPYLYYQPIVHGRAYKSAAWHIHQYNKVLDPDAHWREYGDMTFGVYSKDDKKSVFVDALAWMKTHFGIVEIVKTPMGNYMSKEFVDRRTTEIVAALKANINLGQR